MIQSRAFFCPYTASSLVKPVDVATVRHSASSFATKAVVGSPAFFKSHKAPNTPRDPKGLPCIRYRFTSGALYHWEFERGGIEVEIDVAGPLTMNDQDLMVDVALDSIGLAYVFEAQVETLLAKRKLVRVLADWCPAYPGFFLLYYPSRRQLPAALRAFVDFARMPTSP